jgi:hypothetical protein
VDIDVDPELRRKYTDDAPGVFIDGRKAFKHFVSTRGDHSRSTGPLQLGLDVSQVCVGTLRKQRFRAKVFLGFDLGAVSLTEPSQAFLNIAMRTAE